MKKTLTMLMVLFSAAIISQTFPVGTVSINFKDASRTGGSTVSGAIQMPGSGRDIGVDVYYPALSSTSSSNVSFATGQFPVVVFGHGFVMKASDYTNIYNDLASRGYIIAALNTEGGISPNHTDFGADEAFIAAAMQQLNTTSTPTSVTGFNGHVAQKSAIGGHSMGAGSTFLGAANNTTINCLFNFSAATTNPSSITSATAVTVPLLMISGQYDSVADTTVQNDHYAAAASTKKFHVIIKDAGHCDIGNGNSSTCTIGQAACSFTTNCNSILFNRYMHFLVPFLNNQLKNDCAEGQRFMDSISTTSSSWVGRKITGSLACLTTGIQTVEQQFVFQLAPNPAKENLEVSFMNFTNEYSGKISIINQLGQVLKEENIDLVPGSMSHSNINLTNVSPGVYFVGVKIGQYKMTKKLIKQ